MTRASQRPNVVIFCTDEQRGDHLSCMGHPVLKTPNIDRIAAGGTLFRNAYCSSTTCMPARATMFTGLTNRATGVRSNGVSLPEDVPTLPALLAGAGYRTHSVGKLHLKTWGKPGGVDITTVQTPAENPERRVFWDKGLITKSPDNYYGFQTQDSTLGHVNYINGDYKTWLAKNHPGVFRQGYAYNRDNPSALAIAPELHYNHWIADRAIDFIEGKRGQVPFLDPGAPSTETASRGQEKVPDPFFLWCSFPDPHEPFAAVKKWSDVYADAKVNLPRCTTELSPRSRSETMTAVGLGTQVQDPEYVTKCMRQTFGMISHVDEQIGRVLDCLERAGLADNTVVMFVADHGEQLGEHGLFYKGIYPYDAHAHVPFVAKVPWSAHKGAVVDDVVSMLDLAPTVLDLAGVDQPEDELMGPWWVERHGEPAPSLPGEVLTGVLMDGQRPQRRCALVEYDSDTSSAMDIVQMRMIVTNEYKLVYYAPTDEVMLFDREADPEEQTNLAGEPEYQPVVMKLLKRLLHELCRTESRRPRQICGA